MSNNEKAIGKKIEKALSSVPEAKKEYFLGFAEGVEAANKKQAEKENEPPISEKGRALQNAENPQCSPNDNARAGEIISR